VPRVFEWRTGVQAKARGNRGTRGPEGSAVSSPGSETERCPYRIDLEGRSTLATAVLVEPTQFRANGAESFTVSADGHYVGADGFLVPRDFREFFERDPLWVRRWVRKRVGRRFGQDAVFDLEQELLLYLCTLSSKSRFRERRANGRPMGCADIIQCFDPVRHYGATAARFHNFLNLCLRNRLSTITAKQRREPVCDLRNLSIQSLEVPSENAESPIAPGEIDEAYLLRHSNRFAEEVRRRERAENLILRRYVGEVEEFAARENPQLLTAVQAIQRSRTLREAERSSGMTSREFGRCRRELSLLSRGFPRRGHHNGRRAQKPSESSEVFVQETRRVLLREELYERVWTTSVHRLAKEFGYSDVGLSKLCHKHQIPTPGLGYWRRVELGQKPPRTPLPTVEQPSPYQIELTIREHVPGQRRPEKADVPVVTVSSDKALSHPLIVRLERLFRNAKEDEKSLLVPRAGRASHLMVTQGTFLRALQLGNGLFTACEEHSIQVVWPKEDSSSLTLVQESETVGFCISEILESKAHTPSKEDIDRKKKDYWWSAPKWDYTPTGLLRISLLSGETTSTRKNWSDGKKHRLEECLGEVIAGVGVLVQAIKKVKADRKRWHEEFEAEQKRRREEAERAREIARKGEVIVKAAQALHQSQLIRRLAVRLGNSVHFDKLDNESQNQMRELLTWCAEYANRIDATCQPDSLLRNFYKKETHLPDP
jgi:hypothetical protein